MSKVSIELDLSVVQEAINAKVRPAVEAVLSKYDLPALIKQKLEGKDLRSGGIPMMAYYDVMLSRLGGRTDDKNAPRVIDTMVNDAISTLAKEYVEKAVKSDSKRIEIALRDMMRDSPNALVKTLLAAIESGFENDWAFTMKTEVAPKEIERYSDDRD